MELDLWTAVIMVVRWLVALGLVIGFVIAVAFLGDRAWDWLRARQQ